MLTDIRALADHFLIALPNINKAQAPSSPKYPRTRRIGMEASSRSAHHAPIKGYSNAYTL